MGAEALALNVWQIGTMMILYHEYSDTSGSPVILTIEGTIDYGDEEPPVDIQAIMQLLRSRLEITDE